jgi:hypothetical protein
VVWRPGQRYDILRAHYTFLKLVFQRPPRTFSILMVVVIGVLFSGHQTGIKNATRALIQIKLYIGHTTDYTSKYYTVWQ